MNLPGQGRKKTPTKILERRGSWRAKVRQPTEPQPEPGLPKCPSALTGYAKRTWTEMCQQLSAMGVLTTVDGKALARYCHAWAQWCALSDDETPDPDYKRLDKMLRLSESLLKLEVQFGLTPASRPNVHRRETPAHGNSGDVKDKRRFFA